MNDFGGIRVIFRTVTVFIATLFLQCIGHAPVCSAFSADQFQKKNYLILSRNDDGRGKILASTDRPNDKK